MSQDKLIISDEVVNNFLTALDSVSKGLETLLQTSIPFVDSTDVCAAYHDITVRGEGEKARTTLHTSFSTAHQGAKEAFEILKAADEAGGSL